LLPVFEVYIADKYNMLILSEQEKTGVSVSSKLSQNRAFQYYATFLLYLFEIYCKIKTRIFILNV